MATPNVFPFGGGVALNDLLKRYGGQFDFRETFPVIGVTIGNVIGASAERVSLTIANLGAAAVFISPGLQPSTTRGIPVSAQGAISFSLFEDSLLPCLAWQGISGGAGNTLYVLEVFRFVTDSQLGTGQP